MLSPSSVMLNKRDLSSPFGNNSFVTTVCDPLIRTVPEPENGGNDEDEEESLESLESFQPTNGGKQMTNERTQTPAIKILALDDDIIEG